MQNLGYQMDARFAALRRLSRTYEGVRFAVALTLLFSLVIGLRRALIAIGVHWPDVLLNPDWRVYFATYWAEHWYAILAILVALAVAFVLDAFKDDFRRSIREELGLPRDEEIRVRLRKYTVLILIVVGGLVIIVPPILSMAAGKLTRIILYVLPVLTSVWALYLRRLKRERGSNFIPRIGFFKYPKVRTFNTAGISSTAVEVKGEIWRYSRRAEAGPRSEDALDYIQRGERGAMWGGHSAFFSSLGNLLAVDGGRVCLHPTTTEALQRCVEAVLCSTNRDIFYTDIEYPSVSTFVERLRARNGERFHLVEIRQMMGQNCSAEELAEAVVKQVAEDAGGKGSALLISHVRYDTGQILPLNAIREGLPEVFLVADGAQAIGNIDVEGDVAKLTDCYVTSGHKWLMGEPALGIIAAHRRGDAAVQFDALIDPQFPFSHQGFDLQNDVGGRTINLHPHISLNAMLSEFSRIGMAKIQKHNRTLARRFVRGVEGMAADPVSSDPESGIVTLRVRQPIDARRVKEELHDRFDMQCEALSENRLRFAFHYFQSSLDVDDLIAALFQIHRSPDVETTSETAELQKVVGTLREIVSELRAARLGS